MRVGDLLEWCAAALFVAAAYLAWGVAPALAVAGACLAYLAQCYDATLPLRRRDGPGERT